MTLLYLLAIVLVPTSLYLAIKDNDNDVNDVGADGNHSPTITKEMINDFVESNCNELSTKASKKIREAIS